MAKTSRSFRSRAALLRCGVLPPLLSLFLFLPLLNNCQSFPSGVREERIPGGKHGKAMNGLTAIQEKLVEGAYFIRGRQELVVKGRRFNADCTGTVLAVYWYAGMDLSSPLVHYQGNGVTRLYRFLEDENLIYETIWPEAGDIVFWDNTYDRNGDRRPNDFLTHTGIVVSVEEDGTVHFLHHNYRKGVVMARMNLRRPAVYVENKGGKEHLVNSPMRMRGSPDFDKWLASELTRAFGSAWKAF